MSTLRAQGLNLVAFSPDPSIMLCSIAGAQSIFAGGFPERNEIL
jgi:hypothetical protein